MKSGRDRNRSIYFELLRLIIFAVVVSGIFFVAVFFGGETLLDKYYINSKWAESLDIKYINSLQETVDDEKLSTADDDRISEWVYDNRITFLQIYRNGVLVYDSALTDMSVLGDETSLTYEWEPFYTVKFKDGNAQVSVYGSYKYRVYYYLMAAELIVSFILFLVVIMLGIRKKMDYIKKLSDEIEILEGGDLDCSITVEGHDELALLAEGVDSMRKAFRSQLAHEKLMMDENRHIVTEMSHDLRTPLTSIMLYADILKAGKYKNEQQKNEYISRISDKTTKMKNLLENLFKYLVVYDEEDIELEKPQMPKNLLFDVISETCGYLEHNGFSAELELEWPVRKIAVNMEYIMRIFDNISSNLMKYADKSYPVVITSAGTSNSMEIRISNVCSRCEETEESSGIGIRSIENMMSRMDGYCRVENDDRNFSICIGFRFCDSL